MNLKFEHPIFCNKEKWNQVDEDVQKFQFPFLFASLDVDGQKDFNFQFGQMGEREKEKERQRANECVRACVCVYVCMHVCMYYVPMRVCENECM